MATGATTINHLGPARIRGAHRPLLGHREPRLFESTGSTLEDLVLGAWEDLAERSLARCPVCAGELEPSGCTSCGSELN